ncbi:aldo/keto reductase [candidate division KSB1 bacterium]
MDKFSRRDFLQKSTAVAAGAAIPLNSERLLPKQASTPKVKRYKPFGKTGWNVGDLSAGTGQREPGMIKHLVDCGINLIDTAYQYPGHEEVIGNAIKADPGLREKLFIVDKWDPDLVNPVVTKSELLEQLDVMLERLNTTYIDCLMIHALGHPYMGDITRIQNPAIYEAFEDAKKMGKIKFTGASSCGPKALEEFDWGLDNNRFEVILLGGNFLTRGGETLLKKARSLGVATMAMKTMTTYKTDLPIKELQDQQTNARQAVLKYVLASDLFDTIIIGMGNYDKVNEYLAVSGTTSLTNEDNGHLENLSAIIGPMYCRPTCSGCLNSCPSSVPIASVLRYQMYFESYGEEKNAMSKYAALPEIQSAAMCSQCNAPCENDCSYNIPIRDRMIEAHAQLTFA